MHISTLYEEGQLVESLQRQTETLNERLKKHGALALKSITYNCPFVGTW